MTDYWLCCMLLVEVAERKCSPLRLRSAFPAVIVVVFGAIFLFSPVGSSASASETDPSAFVRDLHDYGCGPVSVYIAAKRLGCDATLRELLDRSWGDEPRRLSLKEICALVHTIPGLRAEGVRLTPEDLPEVAAREDIAAILVIRQDASLDMPNHTVVLESCDDEGITVLDYPVTRRRIAMSALVDAFDGHVILVTKTVEQSGRIRPRNISVALLCVLLGLGLCAGLARVF